MKKNIYGVISFALIGFFLLSGTFTVEGSQNGGNSWVLVDVIHIDAAEEIASVNEKYYEVYHLEGSYSEGIFSLSSTYIGPSDDYYDPPMVNGEFLAFTAYFSTPPQVIYPDDEITINILLSAADNHSYFNPFASVRAQIGKNDQSYWDFKNANGEGVFQSNIKNNYTSIDENVIAIAPGGAEGDTLELRFYLYFGVKMETRYVYEWNEVGGTVPSVPEDEQSTATIGPTLTIGPTPTACPANTEDEKLNYILKLYNDRIPKGKMGFGIINNLSDWSGNEFACGGYQSKVLDFLNGLKFSKDPCERQLMDFWDYGPIQAWYGGHQAVVIYFKGADWKSTGIVLDPWPLQTPKAYSITEWAYMFSLSLTGKIDPLEALGQTIIKKGIGPSEVYRKTNNNYPIFGNDYEDPRNANIRFTAEENNIIHSFSPEKLEAFKKMPKQEQKRLLEHMMQGEDKIHKVIAHCPLNLYIMDGAGSRSGLSGTEILTELPNVSFMILELTDGTNYTEITYPENAGYTLVLEGTDDGQAYVWQGYTLLLGETPTPLQQYSFSVSKGKTYQISTNSLGAPLQCDGGLLEPEVVTEISDGFLEDLPGLVLPETLEMDGIQIEGHDNNEITENDSGNIRNIWIFLLCGFAFICFLLVVILLIVFLVLRNKQKQKDI